MRRLIFVFLLLCPFSSILYAQVNTGILENKDDPEKNEKINSGKVIWEYIIENNKTNDTKLIWKKINDKKEVDSIINNKTLIPAIQKEVKKNKSYDQISNEVMHHDLLDMGRSFPKAKTLKKGDVEINFSQITPFKKSYYVGGTGNQNYSISINYGLNDFLMIEGFYSHSDDPLHKKIKKYDKPVANRWISYGASFTWQFFKDNDLSIALNSSIENWNVASGGCYSYKCYSTSNNIFNDNKEEIINNNFIGSISLPLNYRLTNKLDFHFIKRFILLPSQQSNGSSSGKFYGSSFGLGTGIEYQIFKNLKSYSSLYRPITSGYNSFDENLLFSKKTIYNLGVIYSLDTQVAIKAGLTNGFGLSPSLGTLALPSSDELLYTTSLIYKPKNVGIPLEKIFNKNRLRLGGLSVSTAESLNLGEINVSYYLNNNGSWGNKIVWGGSNRFDFDIATSSIGQNSYSEKPFNGKYHDNDKLFFRGGGKATFFSQNDGDFITSSVRVSAGRLRGVGWLFTELINTYNFDDNLSFNFNPKISYSGIASPAAVGTSMSWQMLNDISLIPEYNFSLNQSNDNWTIAIRISKLKNKYFDIYTTNTLNFIDTGQMQRSDTQSYGFNVGFIF